MCCEAIKKEAELAIRAFQLDIYIQQEASPFCVAKALQVSMSLASEIVLCFSSPLCCQNPSLCRMENGSRIPLKLADSDTDVLIPLNDTVQQLQVLLQKKRVFVCGGVAFVTVTMFLCIALW